VKYQRLNYSILISQINTYLFIILVIAGIILILSGKGLKALGVQIQTLSSPFAGLSSDQWLNIHIIIGVCFLISSILHVAVHYKAFLAYLRGTSRVRIMRKLITILTAALFISAAVPGLVLFFDDSEKRGGQLGEASSSYKWSSASKNSFAAVQGWGRQSLKKQSEAGKLDGSGEGWGHKDGQGERKNYALWHTLSGLLLLLAGGWHFYYNWKVFKAYFTAKSEGKRKFWKELLISAGMVVLVIIGVLVDFPLFVWLLSI